MMIEITREMALLGLGGFLAALLLIFLFIAVADSRRRKYLENMIENRFQELTGRLDYQKAAIREHDERMTTAERRINESESRINKIFDALGNDHEGNPWPVKFAKIDDLVEKVYYLRNKLDAIETAVTADIKNLEFRQDEAFEALKLLKQKIFDVEEELSGPFSSILSNNTDDIVRLNNTCDRIENQFHDRIQNFTKDITDLRLELFGTKKDLGDVTERLYTTSNAFEAEMRSIRKDVSNMTVSVYPSDQKWETVTTVSGLCVEPKKHRKHKKRRDAK